MIIGYARCSTADQNLDWQIDALKLYGCEDIFQEKFTGATKERPICRALPLEGSASYTQLT